MKGSPSKTGYKWWETDDKTKRLYTELLAEKIAKSPKKSTLTRSASSCSDLRSRLEALEGKGTPPTSPVKRASSIRSLTSPEETNTVVQHSPRKYTFETVTMDTLAKYEYIKSPKKKPLGTKEPSSSSSLSSLSLSSSPVPSTSGSDEEYEKKGFAWKTYEVNRSPGTSSREDGSERNEIKPWKFRDNDKNAREQERWSFTSKGKTNEDKAPTTPTRGSLPPKATPKESDKWTPNPMFMLMTSSSKPELKSFGGKTNNEGTGSPTLSTRKERISKVSSKLDEVPEYGSSSSGDNMDDCGDRSSGNRVMERTFAHGREEKSSYSNPRNLTKTTSKATMGVVPKSTQDTNTKAKETTRDFKVSKYHKPTDDQQVNDKTSQQNPTEEELDVNQITKKFQALCEEVEQLEFKMFEFSNDIHKLKLSIGIKDKDGVEKELESPKHHYSYAFTLAAGKDLLSDRVTARALLMRQYSSPTKSPRNIAKLLRDTGLDKEMTEADACKTKALEEELRKINVKDLTDDEIQHILRNAKAKYIENPNYLENTAFGRNSKKG
ncbi:hypothetical protein QZH41_005049 [Actinostola sp. cb2023]|nr:hypothetical protein QZH41_005049 [Actinostola sp. cb2023]